MNLPEKR